MGQDLGWVAGLALVAVVLHHLIAVVPLKHRIAKQARDMAKLREDFGDPGALRRSISEADRLVRLLPGTVRDRVKEHLTEMLVSGGEGVLAGSAELGEVAREIVREIRDPATPLSAAFVKRLADQTNFGAEGEIPEPIRIAYFEMMRTRIGSWKLSDEDVDGFYEAVSENIGDLVAAELGDAGSALRTTLVEALKTKLLADATEDVDNILNDDGWEAYYEGVREHLPGLLKPFLANPSSELAQRLVEAAVERLIAVLEG